MKMRPVNPWITNAMLDSCAFDPKYHPEQQAATELFRLAQEQDLRLLLAHSTQKEVEHPNTPRWVKTEAASRIFSINVALTGPEAVLKEKLHELMTGNGDPLRYKADAEHLFEAQKYGSYFVTTDKRILDRATRIADLCGLNVLLPSQFLQHVEANPRVL